MLSKMFLFITLITFLSFVLVHASSPSLNPRYQVLDPPEPKRLSAGTLSSKLKARAETTAPLFQRKRSFDYAATDVEEESVFSTTLDVESRWPILALEELDSEFNSIVCTESNIHFSFVSAAAAERFNTEIKSIPKFVVVTSHDGCDLEGDRSAHRVTNVNVDPEHYMGTLDIVPMNWHEAFPTTRVSFARRHPSEIQKRVATQVKREDAPSPTQSFPAAPSDVDGLNSSANADFNVRHTGLEIYPIDAPLADEVVPDLPVVVRCKTCAIRGDIQLSQGQFSVGHNTTAEDDEDFEVDEAIGFFTNSSVELLVKRMFSQIELEFELESEGPLIEFSVPLPTIPLVPFQIAGVLTFGPQIVPNIIITADLEGDVGFSYGFNATVPEDSRIHIKIPEFNESSITGFSDTEFDQIPFSASTTISSMSLGISFQPQILLGINTGLDALNVNIDGGIGAFVSIPSLSLNVSHATGVNENCDAVVSGSDSDSGNATHLVPSVELDVGVIASYDVRFMSFNDSRGVAPVLASTAWDLPTACVGFEPEERAEETGKADSAEGGRGADGDNGGGNGAVRVARESAGMMLLGSIALMTVAVGFCGWG